MIHCPRLPSVLVSATLFLAGAAAPLAAQPCGTPGRDGSGTITGIVNSYYPGTASVAAGALSIPVGARSGAISPIAAGDLLLVMQMQDAAIDSDNNNSYGDGVNGDPARGSTNLNNSGRYEFVVATGAVSGGAVPVLGGGNGGALLNSYTNAAATSTQGQRRFQVIRVPQYSAVTLGSGLTALAWNGSVGGVLAIDVSGNVALGGATVSVEGRGFRGGGWRSLAGGGTGFSNTAYRTLATQPWNGSKAEGVAGTPRYVWNGTTLTDTGVEGYPNGSYARGAPGNAGGGGTDGNVANDENSGGGGGGNAGNGGNGGNTWNSNLARGGFGGAAVPPIASRLTLGGGGGAGSSNNNGPTHGAPGGGMILFRLNSLSGIGTWNANGATAGDPVQDGGGGGGAGGSVFAAACNDNSFSGLTVNARGGLGGDVDWNDNDHHGPGGGGGGGGIFLSDTGATLSVLGGANGISPPNSGYGATDGSAGTTSTAVTVSSAPGARPGCVCAVTQALVHSFHAVPDGRSLSVEWRTASEVATAGFHLFRRDPDTGGWQRVTERLLPAAQEAPQGAVYRFADTGASSGEPQTYMLQEIERRGRMRWYGPFPVDPAVDPPANPSPSVGPGLADNAESADGFSRLPLPLNAPNPPEEARLRTAAALPADIPRGIRNASALKLRVGDAGIYAIHAADIAAAFLVSEEVVRDWIAHRNFRLAGTRMEVTWHAAPGNGAILFYGEAIDAPYVAENVYWLTPDEPGRRPKATSGRSPIAAPGLAFPATAHAEQDRFPAVAIAPEPESDYWFWETLIAGDASFGTRSLTVDLAAPAPGDGALTVHLQGASSSGAEGEHRVTVTLNGTTLGEAAWQGVAPHTATFPVAGGLLREGSNAVELTARLEPEVPFSISYVDALDIAWPRFYSARGGALFLRGGVHPTVTVDGFATPSIQVWDLGSARRPVAVEGLTIEPAPGSGWQASFAPAAGDRLYVAFEASGVRAPGLQPWIEPELPLSDPASAADHLIVAPAALVQAAEELAEYRRGRGVDSRVIPLEQIHDELAGGLADPRALRAFLVDTTRAWPQPPSTVVLAGSGTYDYRGLLGLGDNLMPPLLVRTSQGLFASDTALVEGTAIRIGRLPATSAAQLSAMIAKIVAYETSAPGSWQRQVLLLADNPDDGGEFAWESELAASQIPTAWSASRIHLGELPVDEARRRILDGFNGGAFLVNYLGHAGLDRLAAEPLLTSADLPLLANGERLPVVAAMSCVVGRFEIPGFASLAEQLVSHEGGGAVAVWAPSGTNYNAQSGALDRAFVEALFVPGDGTLGGALWRATKRFLAAGGSADTLRSYNLFGDPALLLQRGE
jgi:hypothetical protein